jgi:hypothetical protein
MEIVRLLDGYVGVWGDLDRMHLEEPLPAEAPAYTHLWAWREGVYARVRLDPTADRHVLGVLVLLGSPLPGGGSPERIDVEVLPVLGWGDDPRVQRLPEQLRCPRLERLVTIQEAAITFVRPVAPGGAT